MAVHIADFEVVGKHDDDDDDDDDDDAMDLLAYSSNQLPIF